MQGLYACMQGFEQKIQGLFKDFQGLHSVQKRALSPSFLVPPQHEQFHPEGLLCFPLLCN